MEGWTGNADDMTLVISPTARLGQTDERSNWELDTWMPMFCGLVTCGYIAAIQQGDGYLLLLGSRDCLCRDRWQVEQAAMDAMCR